MSLVVILGRQENRFLSLPENDNALFASTIQPIMSSIAVLHASQLVTLAGPKRPRVGRELSELAIIPDGGMLIRDGKIDIVGPNRDREEGGRRANHRCSRKSMFFPVLSMRTHTWFSPGIGWTISSGACAATLMNKSQRPGAEFGQPLKRREQRVKPTFLCKRKSMQDGSCAAARQLWSQNQATV